jgi:Cu(I)/Ag(I) efflux system membrane protein CusA/SilA
VGGYVKRARRVVESSVGLPPGVSLVWSGQYEYMQRANERLAVVVPLTLGIIFFLLYAHFHRMVNAAVVLGSTLILAPVGGVWLMWWFGFHLSVATGVGFIALAGLATEMSVVMVAFLDEATERAEAEGRLGTVGQLREAVAQGAVDRVRPLLMTVGTTLVGLLPVLGAEAGSRVMRRLAAPMVGGLVSSIVLALVVLPAVYLLWKRVGLPRQLPDAA